MDAGEPVIRTVSLKKTYGNVTAVDDLSIEVSKARSSDFSGRTEPEKQPRSI